MPAEGYALPGQCDSTAGPNRINYIFTHVIGVTLSLAALAWAANWTGMDLRLASWLYDPVAGEFPLRHSEWSELLAHRTALTLPIGLGGLTFAVALASCWAPGLRNWRPTLWAMVASFCLVPFAIDQFKHHTALPRPIDGYADADYALLILYFCGRAMDLSRLRWWGLAVGLATGLLFSAVRILQGAHFLSQALWSVTLAWLVTSMLFIPVVPNRRPAHSDQSQALDTAWKRLSIVQVQRRYILWAVGIAISAALLFLSSEWPPGSALHQGVEQVGLIFIFAAILGRAWCSLYIGDRKGRELMTQGPYSIGRNPLYFFSIIGVLGIGAQSGSLLVGPLMAMLVYAVFRRVISEEESVLRQTFGRDFDDYCERVPRFGPRPSTWRSADRIEVSVPALWNTIRDALPYFLSLPIFRAIEALHQSGWLPVLIRLP